MAEQTVTYSLESVLKDIKDSIKEVDQKIDTLQRDVYELKVEITQTQGDIKVISQQVEGMDKRLEKVENEQTTIVKAVSDLQGFRALFLPAIVGIISAVIGAISTQVFRVLFLGNNPQSG